MSEFEEIDRENIKNKRLAFVAAKDRWEAAKAEAASTPHNSREHLKAARLYFCAVVAEHELRSAKEQADELAATDDSWNEQPHFQTYGEFYSAACKVETAWQSWELEHREEHLRAARIWLD